MKQLFQLSSIIFVKIVHSVADLSKLLEENKKGDSQFLLDKSPTVPPTIHNLNDIVAGAIDLARVWDAYGHLTKAVN